MHSMVPLACFLSLIRPPGVQYENALLQIAPVDKAQCPFVKNTNDIGFQLFTRHNPTVFQELMVGDDERLFASHMDWSAPTVLYFHAFMEQPEDGSAVLVREAYMQRGDSNVIMVDAHRLEAGPWYFTAAHNTWYIGRFAAMFVDYMVSRGLDLNKTHFVGHSLGAQAAGVAGAALTTGRVARITGLDPALPLFAGLPLPQRLDTSDAHFVDVIHTDAGIFGYKEPIGHVDFFPNGGQSPQPGCELEVVIPQQLLLNKCDGTERPQGFYMYELRASPHQPHSTTNTHASSTSTTKLSKHRKLLSTTHKYKKHVMKTDTRHTYEHSTSSNNLREKRVKRSSGAEHVGDNETIRDAQLDKSPHATLTASNVQRGGGQHQDNNTTTVVPDNGTRSHVNEQTSPQTSTSTVLDINTNGKMKDILRRTKLTRQWNSASSDETHTQRISARVSPPTQGKTRQKRFLQLFRSDNDDSFIFKALNFLVKNRKSVVPIVSVARDISTLVRSANGELNHVTRETNNYVGVSPPDPAPLTYSLELAGDSKLVAFLKRLFGLTPKGDRLTIGSG